MLPKSCPGDYCMSCSHMPAGKSFMFPGTARKQNGVQPTAPGTTIRGETCRSNNPIKRGYLSGNWLCSMDYRFILSERFFINSNSDGGVFDPHDVYRKQQLPVEGGCCFLCARRAHVLPNLFINILDACINRGFFLSFSQKLCRITNNILYLPVTYIGD